MSADLHIHSTVSDGVYSPIELVNLARQEGFKAIAITDHDSTDGVKEALKAGRKLGIEVISGLEMSTLSNGREIHILGYCFDLSSQLLKHKLQSISEARNNRANGMVNKLNNLGYGISMKDVRKLAGGANIGRPHIATALKEKGYISNISEAFTKELIGRNGRAYVERYEISPEEAIALVSDCGGVAVLAHPGYLSDRNSLDFSDIVKLEKCGLKGIEVYYSYHSSEQVKYYKEIAEKLNLLVTGGSDFHGNESDYLLGQIRLPYYNVQLLLKCDN